MENVSKTTRLSYDLVNVLKFRTKMESVDESTALRQLLILGTREYAVQLYKEGRISLREAAKLCNIPLREMMEIFTSHGIKSNLNYDQLKKSLELIR
ncbi:MAG: UPF0175 family protein [Candidatus Micrarchaeota archaeon]